MQRLPAEPFVETCFPDEETLCVVRLPTIATLTSWNGFVCSSIRPGRTFARWIRTPGHSPICWKRKGSLRFDFHSISTSAFVTIFMTKSKPDVCEQSSWAGQIHLKA